ncbi:MAG TPA: hypothetical protein VGM92_13250 [Candidatus Kapabacteria bacterium]|jgi:hypothetical protein
MQKRLIFILFVLSAFIGCKDKTRTTGIGTETVTTMIRPPSVMAGVAGPITLTATMPANKIFIAAIFSGANIAQTVVLRSSAGGNLATFSNAPGGNLIPISVPGPIAGITYTATAQVGGQPYIAVQNIPNNNPEANIASTYTDGAGNAVTVIILDGGTP